MAFKLSGGREVTDVTLDGEQASPSRGYCITLDGEPSLAIRIPLSPQKEASDRGLF